MFVPSFKLAETPEEIQTVYPDGGGTISFQIMNTITSIAPAMISPTRRITRVLSRSFITDTTRAGTTIDTGPSDNDIIDPSPKLSVSFEDISRATYRVRDGIESTSCNYSTFLSKKLGVDMYLKKDYRQMTGRYVSSSVVSYNEAVLSLIL